MQPRCVAINRLLSMQLLARKVTHGHQAFESSRSASVETLESIFQITLHILNGQHQTTAPPAFIFFTLHARSTPWLIAGKSRRKFGKNTNYRMVRYRHDALRPATNPGCM